MQIKRIPPIIWDQLHPIAICKIHGVETGKMKSTRCVSDQLILLSPLQWLPLIHLYHCGTLSQWYSNWITSAWVRMVMWSTDCTWLLSWIHLAVVAEARDQHKRSGGSIPAKVDTKTKYFQMQIKRIPPIILLPTASYRYMQNPRSGKQERWKVEGVCSISWYCFLRSSGSL